MADSSSENFHNADLDTEEYEMEQNSARAFIEEHGIAGFDNYITKRVSTWKSMLLNIAITGFTGVGKSTLINTFCGITPEDDGAAETGTTECTHFVKCYPHPTNGNLKFWDLPGVGTEQHPRETYLAEMQFERFDFILIINGNRFTEDDLWLAQTLKDMNKNFFFIRSKIDDDLQNAKRDYPRQFKEADELVKIRNSCIKHLTPINGTVQTVYLVSGLLEDTSKYDYGKLMDDLIENYPKLKQQALVLSLSSTCKEVIKAKAAILREQWKITAAVDAVIIGAPPLPGLCVSPIISNNFVVHNLQIDNAIKAFGLDYQAIEKMAYSRNMSMKKFETVITQVSANQSKVKAFLEDVRGTQHPTSNKSRIITMAKMLPIVSGWVAWKSIRAEWIRFVDELEVFALQVIDIIINSEAH